MKLLLHAGTQKTGSSYIQTALKAKARQLVDAGILYSAEHFAEGDRFGGVQGDGGFLAVLFRDRDDFEFVRRLSLIRDKAQEADCGSALISYSGFWRDIRERGHEDLMRLARKAGFDGVEGLLLLRDPIDHAMSHYRQVVKVGRTTKAFDGWITTDYHYFDWLAEVVTANSEIEWTARRYQPARRAVDLVVFEDWLGLSAVEPESRSEGQRVNSSLTADEALCIVDLAAGIPGIHEALAPRFLSLPPSSRPAVGPAEDWMRAVAAKYCRRYVAAVRAMNGLLPLDERFELASSESVESTEYVTYRLTKAQEALVDEGREAHLREHGTRWRRYSVGTSIRKWLFDRAPRPVRRAYRMALRPLRRRRV